MQIRQTTQLAMADKSDLWALLFAWKEDTMFGEFYIYDHEGD